MTFKRLLILLRSYPTVTPPDAIKAAVDIAVSFDAKVSALSCAILPHVPKSIVSGVIGGVPGLAGEQRQRIVGDAQRLLRTFSDAASQAGVLGKALYRSCAASGVPKLVS
jgi:hypothetical protein